MHISSLPGDYGIGTMGREAKSFVNFLKSAGQKYWQMLPVGPTSYGDSPYQSFSSYAGNPYFIDPEDLVARGLVYENELERFKILDDVSKVDYGRLFIERKELYKLAFSRFNVDDLDFQSFVIENNYWLKDYALYMAIKIDQGNKSWVKWEDKYKFRDKDALREFEETHGDEISFYLFEQYIFFSQWEEFKDFLHVNGIQTIGDLPIYVAEDSADVWANPELFKLDEDLNAFVVGGVPPDAFTEDGQLWGNPVYDWKIHEYTNFTWWVDRIKWNFSIFDILRIDHFRGFASYWEVPKGDETARNGKWVEGPGIKLFDKIKEELGDVPIIVEDLGVITEDVEILKEQTKFPGMMVLQFAFSPFVDSEHAPHNGTIDSVMYIGTHDNYTISGWMESGNPLEIEFARKYLNLTEEEGYNWGFIRGAMTSVCRLVIIQMQDILNLDNHARMNSPGTLGGNWEWRMKREELTDDIGVRLKNITEISKRL